MSNLRQAFPRRSETNRVTADPDAPRKWPPLLCPTMGNETLVRQTVTRSQPSKRERAGVSQVTHQFDLGPCKVVPQCNRIHPEKNRS